MSKIMIILCAVLFASAASASSPLETAQRLVIHFIDTSIGEMASQFGAANERARKIGDKYKNDILEFEQRETRQMEENLKSVRDQAASEVAKLTDQAKDVDVTECTDLTKHLELTGKRAIANMSICANERIQTAETYIANMETKSQETRQNLTSLRTEAGHCLDNADGIVEKSQALLCTSKVGANAVTTVAKATASIAYYLAKLRFLAIASPSSLGYCSITGAMAAFYFESSTLIERTKLCVQQKINEASNSIKHID